MVSGSKTGWLLCNVGLAAILAGSDWNCRLGAGVVDGLVCMNSDCRVFLFRSGVRCGIIVAASTG